MFDRIQPSSQISASCSAAYNAPMPSCGTPEFDTYMSNIKTSFVRDTSFFDSVSIEIPLVPITTSTTVETVTTTLPPTTPPAIVYPDYPCGTFAKFDTINGVETNGVVAGVYEDGTLAFVGYGNNSNSNCNVYPCPGRVTTNPANPGIYMPCGATDQYDIGQVSFLLNHPNLKWELTDVNHMNNLVGRIQVPRYSATPFLFGRIKIGNYTQLGKVRNWPDYAFRFMQDGNENTFYSGFEVLTCTTPPPCGTFVKYDPINNINDPAIKGFSAGPAQDDTAAYVGHGNSNQGNANCQNPCPGRISTNPLKPGAYMPCYGQIYDPTTAYYLLNHDDLRWVRTDYINMRTLSNAVQVMSYTGYPMLYGRIKIGDHYTVGKVHNGNGYFAGYFPVDDGSEQTLYYGYDVLVCDSSLPKSITPAVTPDMPTPPAKCGDVVKYDVVNNRTDPETKGFFGGIYTDGSKGYVGYGNFPRCSGSMMPGRITTDFSKPGIYSACSGQVDYDSVNVYYMLNHTNLSWQPTINVPHSGRAGNLRVFDAAGNSWYYARIYLGTYTQLAKVYNGYNDNTCWYGQDGKELSTKNGFDVLTCDPPTCGSFAKFDAKGNYAQPDTNGFVGGTFSDGRKSYVGYGYDWNNNCNQFPAPGRISTDPVKKGTYMPCGGDVLDSDYGYYLLNHGDLRWVETDFIAMRTLPGAITITSNSGYPTLFGRVKIGNRYSVGKVHNGKGIFGFFFTQDDGTEALMTYGFEVLVCNSNIPAPAV